MGRKGSILVPFLVEGLEGKKYGRYLSGNIDNIIQIILPRKTKNLSSDSMKILKDWNLKKGRKFKDQNDYTKAKQGMLAALRRSDYLERISSLKPKLCYKILDWNEVQEKKRKLKGKKRSASVDELESPSSVDSGFYNSVESPKTDQSHEMDVEYVSNHDILDYDSGNESQFCDEVASSPGQSIFASNECSNNRNILDAIRHDHDAYFSNAVQNQDAANLSIDQVSSDLDKLALNQIEPLELTDSQYEELLDQVSFDESTFSDIHFMKEDDVAQVYSIRVLKLNSEHSLGETSFLVCEPADTVIHLNKSVYDSIPLDCETSQRLQPHEVLEVRQDEDIILFLFSDLDMIVLSTDVSERLKLSQIAEVKRLDKHVLFFLNPQKCVGSN